jgi:hypothetical protein
MKSGAFTLGQSTRGIFFLSSHVQVSKLGLIGRTGLELHKIALMVDLTA